MLTKKISAMVNAALLCASAFLGMPHGAKAATLPDLINQPPGLDLGATSFFDGFSRNTPGFVVLNFLRYTDSNQISGPTGAENPAFTKPKITAVTDFLQGLWISPLKVAGGHLGVTWILPVASISSSFGENSRDLTTNHTNFGDMVFAPVYQGLPIFANGRPIFSQRFVFSVYVPTGAFNHSVSINQSSGYWSINPYWAFTVLPTPSFEISARLNYIYNFQSTNFGNPPKIPHVTFINAQAGQAGYIDFAASQAITKVIGLGINGFYLDQFNNDRVNGLNIPQSRRSELYLGPGANFKFSKVTFLNANIDLPVSTANVANGPQFNIQFIHYF